MRSWHETVAAIGDVMPGGVFSLWLVLLALTLLAMLLWYFFPEWAIGLARIATGVVRSARGFRWRGFRWRGFRWRRRRGEPAEEPSRPEQPEPAEDEVPAVPAAALVLSADDLAAQGRYREAVRERLRAMVRDLAERGVIVHHPGWTVTELAGAAGWARPSVATPLGSASEVFSRIWYGQRTATAADDAAMRAYATQVRADLGQRVAAG